MDDGNPIRDAELVSDYVQTGSEEAFKTLVRRHSAMVFTTCRRGLGGDAAAAEDAAQAVFILLAQRARKLRNRQALGAWLFWTAKSVADHMARAEARRRLREQEASAMNESPGRTNSEVSWWTGLEERLNDAIAGLREQYREAVVLHVLEGMSQRDVAHTTGCSEEAVRKRIARGLESLRRTLARRGAVVSAAALSAHLAEQAAEAAPADLVASCQAAGLAAVTGAAAAASVPMTIAEGVTRMLLWTKVRVAAAVTGAVALAGAGVAAGLTEGKATWRSIGPGHFGAMFGPGISPHDSKTIVAGVDMGHAFMTRDGGTTWKILGRNAGLPAEASAQAQTPFANPAYRGMVCCGFDPKRPERIFVGGTHGLSRTTDGGENWRLVLGGGPGLCCGAIAVDPTDPNVVYCGNGMAPRHGISWSQGDVWKSTDGGDTWQAVTPPEHQGKHHIWLGLAVDPRSPFAPGKGHSRVYVYGQQDFMVSEDAGESWTSLKASVPGERWLSGLVLAPGKERATLFAAVAAGMVGPEKKEQAGGVYRSDDGGRTWTAKNKGLEKNIEWMATQGRKHGGGPGYVYSLLVGCAAKPAVMYFASHPHGVFKTVDGGESWRGLLDLRTDWVKREDFEGKDASVPLRKHGGNFDRSFYSQWGPANGLACSATDPDAVVYTDNATIGVSFDGGKRWSEPGFEFGQAVWPDKFGDRPPSVYTHKVRSRGIQLIQPHGAAIDPFDPKTIAIGHGDTGLWLSRDGGEWWEHAYEGIAGGEKNCIQPVLYDPSVRGRMWVAGGGWGRSGHVYRSDDGGRTFRPIGIPELTAASSNRLLAVHALALDPDSAVGSRALYAGTDNGLYKTPDGGKTWRALSLGLKRRCVARRLAVDPTKPDRVYAGVLAGAESGLYRTENGGATWTRLAADKMAAVQSISICKAGGALYALGDRIGQAPGGFWSQRTLWRSDDHGETWRQVDDRPYLQCAAVHPRDPDRVYAVSGAMDVTKEAVNVWRSRDGGKTWTAIADDIPLSPVGQYSEMVFDPSNPHRFLVLHNSGTFEGREAR
ncbi:MAG: sigma-70 family RNA polymerase sigma factor [Kiritimatiellae bacterium]|nr:sigma-70 family RNA polymerase sigma factor [Kiritimatiellia bacterium]